MLYPNINDFFTLPKLDSYLDPILNPIPQATTKPLTMIVEGNLLYTYYQQGHRLNVIDITDIYNPVTLANLYLGNLTNANYMVMKDGVLYFPGTSSSILFAVELVYDVLGNIIGSAIVATAYTNSGPFGCCISGNYLFVAGSSSGGVAVHDISDPSTSIAKVGNTDNFGAAGDCEVRGNYLYTTHYASNSLRVYDISNPVTPTFVTAVSLGNMPVHLNIHGSLLICTDYATPYFDLLNIADPSTPLHLARVQVVNGTVVKSCVGIQNLIYVSGAVSGRAGVTCYDVADPTNPVLKQQRQGDVGSSNANNDALCKFKDEYILLGQHLVAQTRIFTR